MSEEMNVDKELAGLFERGRLMVDQEKILFANYLLDYQSRVDHRSRAFAIQIVRNSAAAIGLKVSTVKELLHHLEADERLR